MSAPDWREGVGRVKPCGHPCVLRFGRLDDETCECRCHETSRAWFRFGGVE